MKNLSYLGEFDSQLDVRYLTGIFTLKNDPQFWIISYRDIYGPFLSLEEAENAGQEFEIYDLLKELKENPIDLIEKTLEEKEFKTLISTNTNSISSGLATAATYLTIPPMGSFPPAWVLDLAEQTNDNRIKQLTLAAAFIVKEIERLQDMAL